MCTVLDGKSNNSNMATEDANNEKKVNRFKLLAS